MYFFWLFLFGLFFCVGFEGFEWSFNGFLNRFQLAVRRQSLAEHGFKHV